MINVLQISVCPEYFQTTINGKSVKSLVKIFRLGAIVQLVHSKTGRYYTT
jgi:hypothetical protein